MHVTTGSLMQYILGSWYKDGELGKRSAVVSSMRHEQVFS